MADPITILGTAGAVANIIDVLGKIINTVADLRSQWNDADLSVLNLESQLGALKAALNKIKDWTESSFDDPHHQLVMDLDRCVVCCRTLINKIDAEVSQFQRTPENRLDAPSKFRLLLKTKDFENVQRMIQQQTGALTLLLTATTTTIVSEQKTILHQSQTRRIFKKMETETASLYVHRDVDSLVTSYPGTSISSSKRSIEFAFDAELFISRIYKRWMKGSVKRSLHEQQSDISYSTRRDRKSDRKSQTIDQTLEEDAKMLRRECKVLLLGSESREVIPTMIRSFQGLSEEELSSHRLSVFQNVCESAKALVKAMRLFNLPPESDEIWEHIDFITAFVLESGQVFDPSFKTAVEALLGSPYYSAVMDQHTKFNIPDSAIYFLKEIARIASPDYLPNEMDVLQAKTKNSAIFETRLQMGHLSALIFDVGGQKGEIKKWIHCFENVTCIIFVADLDSYDEVFLENDQENRMMESLLEFDSVVNSRWFLRSSIILLLNNVGKFKQKLATSPLENYFPDYSGGNDVNKAAKYLLWRFNQLNRAHLNIYPHLMDSSDTSTVRLIFAAIKEVIISDALRDTMNLR